MSSVVHNALHAHSWSEAWKYSKNHGLCVDFSKEQSSPLILRVIRSLGATATLPESFEIPGAHATTQFEEKLGMSRPSLILLESSIIPPRNNESCLTLFNNINRKLDDSLLFWDNEIDIIRTQNRHQLDFAKHIDLSKELAFLYPEDLQDLQSHTFRLDESVQVSQKEKLAATKQCFNLLVEVIQERKAGSLKSNIDHEAFKLLVRSNMNNIDQMLTLC
jgi:hypothetical protein